MSFSDDRAFNKEKCLRLDKHLGIFHHFRRVLSENIINIRNYVHPFHCRLRDPISGCDNVD